MALYFVIHKDGGDENVPLREGLVIGRAADVDIRLNDPAVSSRHATIKRDSGGNFVLVDLGSRNAINFGGSKVKKLSLSRGVKFSISRVFFETIDIEDTVATRENLVVASVPPATTWRDKITKMSRSVQKSVVTDSRDISPFGRGLVLRFISGLQHNLAWQVAYGPRSFGSEVPEFNILESGAPSVCFTLAPEPKGVLFSTDFPTKVLLNGKAVNSDILKGGDEIQIFETKILVEYI